MRNVNTILAAILAGALAVGCDNGQSSQSNTPRPPSANSKDAGQDHDHDHGAAHAGERHDLGNKEIGGVTVQVTQIGDVKGGAEVPFEIVVSGAQPQAVRAWLGNEAGEGSVRVKAALRGNFLDADIEVPENLPEGSQLWVEIESGGTKQTGAYGVKSH